LIVAQRKAEPAKAEVTEWVYEHNGVELAECDFTLASGERLDNLTGIGNAVSNPLVNARVAKCWVQVALEQKDLPPADAAKQASEVTYRDLYRRFRRRRLDEDFPAFGDPSTDDDGNVSVPT
jgi:hypothetical protein